MKQHQTKPVLCYEVQTLKSWDRRFAIVTIDRAANDYALISRRFYVNCLLAEVGIFSNSNANIYS